MSFLERFSIVRTEIGQKVIRESRETGESLRLKNAISANEQKIRHLYMEIGEMYYKNKKEEPESFAESMIEAVSVLMMENEENRKKISVLKGSVICPNCGFGNRRGTKFCGECGAKLPEQLPALREVICPDCGVKAKNGMRFCVNCGRELVKKREESEAVSESESTEDFKKQHIGQEAAWEGGKEKCPNE